jgi:soluble lytic murein transglycosylase-like protein
MESPATMEESCLSACQISRTGSLASLTDPASLEARPIDVIVAVPEGGRKRQKPSVARRNIDDRRPFAAVVLRAAERYRVDADLLHALIEVESGYRSDARSPRGAMGLMQLMPVTVEAYGVTDPYDPQENIDAGAQHLRRLLDVFDMAGALAAYNAGQGAVRRFGGIPPYPETRRYVRRILDLVTALEDE